MPLRLMPVAVALTLVLSACAVNQPPLVIEPFLSVLTTADARQTEIRIIPPTNGCRPCDAIVFSHGFNLSHSQYDALTDVWAAAGYLVIAPLHMDSEAHPERANINPATTLESRLHDIIAVVARLDDTQSPLVPGLRYSGRYFAAGHSFGGAIAQLAGGATTDDESPSLMTRLSSTPEAIIAISPPGTIEGYYTPRGWRHIKRPHLVVTGTTDIVPGIAPEWDAHLDSFKSSPANLSFGLVFDDMDHYFDGEFGRIKSNADPYRVAAVATLNTIVLRFMASTGDSNNSPRDYWDDLNSDQVQALLR